MRLDVFLVAGVVGAAIIVAAYFADQQEWVSSRNWRYPFANLIGACLILMSLYSQWNLPTAVIEGFWAAVSLYGLTKRLSKPNEG